MFAHVCLWRHPIVTACCFVFPFFSKSCWQLHSNKDCVQFFVHHLFNQFDDSDSDERVRILSVRFGQCCQKMLFWFRPRIAVSHSIMQIFKRFNSIVYLNCLSIKISLPPVPSRFACFIFSLEHEPNFNKNDNQMDKKCLSKYSSHSNLYTQTFRKCKSVSCKKALSS